MLSDIQGVNPVLIPAVEASHPGISTAQCLELNTDEINTNMTYLRFEIQDRQLLLNILSAERTRLGFDSYSLNVIYNHHTIYKITSTIINIYIYI